MKGKTMILASLALVLVLGASIGAASAFFTTYAVAKGGYPVQFQEETVEWLSNWTKHVSVTNSETSSAAVFVRARAVWSDDYSVTYAAQEGWTDGGDGWWYYNTPVVPGGKTPDLDVHISDVPEKVTDGASFNIVVYTESTPAGRYTDPKSADWNNIVAKSEETGQGGTEK